MAGQILHRVCLMSSMTLPRESFKLTTLDYGPATRYYDSNRRERCGTCFRAISSNQNFGEEGYSPTVDIRNETPKKKSRKRRLENLITVNRSDCNWADVWETQQVTTLEDLGLKDMVLAPEFPDPRKPRSDIVLVDCCTSKAGWGFFVKGRISTSVHRQCNRCLCKYSSEVDSTFEVWLSPTKDEFVHPQQTGEDNDDPMVIYFPPGQEIADLTSMVRDTIRLSQASKAICSEACKSTGPRIWESKEDRPSDSKRSPFEALRKVQI